MPRRLHVPPLTEAGKIDLPPAEAHHARSVLRLRAGEPVELFDDIGRTAAGVIVSTDAAGVRVEVSAVSGPSPAGPRVSVASAVPKGERADWLVEKLGELGVERWMPLVTARSVVTPGRGKLDRWGRLAVEAAKQSRRAGVMAIGEVTPLAAVLGAPAVDRIWFSTGSTAEPIAAVLAKRQAAGPLTLLVGPEGGWTDEECVALTAAGATAAKLTATVLRVETAAVVGAGVAMLAGS